MNPAMLAALPEPAALLGAGVAGLAGLGVLWRYRGSQSSSLKRYLRRWRLMQVLGISALYFLALAASCLILQDHWGWVYLIVGVRAGVQWYRLRLARIDLNPLHS
jgi:hypothetical protein